MTRVTDWKRRDLEFKVGDRVLLSTQNQKLAVAGAAKFKAKFIGPSEVLKKIGKVAYELKLPYSMARVHPVFHVLLLKAYNDGGREEVITPPVVLDGEEWYVIEKAIDHRDH